MKVCSLHSVGDFRFEEIDKPKPKGKEILLKVSSCGLCGSDIPRIYLHGSSNGKYPLIIGHEFGGKIVEVGSDADKSLIGKCGAVFPLIPCNKCAQCKDQYYAMCENYDYLGSRSNGGFAQYCLIPSEWNFIEAPSTIDKNAFAMVEPCTVAQHAVRSSKLAADDSIIIFGAGPIGIMAARWAKHLSAKHLALVDVVDEKVKFANDKGFYCINSAKQDISLEWEKHTGLKYADKIIEGTGFGNALGGAIDLIKPHGQIVLMGNPAADTQIKLAQHSKILRKEANICGIWNSYYKSKNIDEWSITVQEIANGNIKVDDLISHKVNLEQLPDLCDNIWTKKTSICKAIYCSDLD